MKYNIKLILYFLLTVFSISLFYVEINHYNQHKTLNQTFAQYTKNLAGLNKVTNLIFSLQRERGMSTGLSVNSEYETKLAEYINDTNQKINELKRIERSDFFYEFVTQIENDIRLLRKQNALAYQTKEDIFKSYTVLINLLLKKIRIIQAEQHFIAQQSDNKLSKTADLYSLIRAIELGGQLRAKLSRFLTSDNEQTTLNALRHALDLNSRHNLSLRVALENKYPDIEQLQSKQYINNLMSNLIAASPVNIDTLEWWNTTTAYLNVLIEQCNATTSQMTINGQALITDENKKARIALIKALTASLFCFIFMFLLIRLLTRVKQQPNSKRVSPTLHITILFVGVASVLCVEHYASQKHLKYFTNLETIRSLNSYATDNISKFEQLWHTPTVDRLIATLTSKQPPGYSDVFEVDITQPSHLKVVNSASLNSIIQTQYNTLRQGGVISKVVETPSYGVVYLIAGLTLTERGLTNTLLVHEVNLNHLVAKSKEKISDIRNKPRTGYFVKDDLLFFEQLNAHDKTANKKQRLLTTHMWDNEFDLGAYAFENANNKTEFLSTVENKFIWQISSLISLFVLALYITNKSQEKNRKQALQDQDTIKTRQLFMSASEKLAEIGSFELNIKTKVMHTSEGFRNLFGLPSTSELISIRTILKRFDKTERRKIISNLKQLNLNNTAELQVELNGHEQRYFNLVSKIRFQQSEQFYSLIGVVKETTNLVKEANKQKQIQYELDTARKEALSKMYEAEKQRQSAQSSLAIKRSTEKLLQEAINGFPASIILLNENHEIAMKNLYPDPIHVHSENNVHSFMGVYFESGEQIKNVIEKLPLVEKEELLEMLNYASQSAQYCFDLQCRYTINSSEYWFEILLKNISTESEKYTLICQTDITRNINSAKELHAAKIKAEQASEAKSRFLATMSHEIRTPINGVIGMLDILGESKLDTEQIHLTQVAKNSALILLRVINDILDFSKIEAGQMELELIAFSWLDLIEEMADLLAYQANDKKLKLAFYFSSELTSEQVGDPIRLRQILLNLIGNALKFTKTTATVSGLVEVTIAPSKRPAHYIISIKDNGKGLSSQQADRLFTPFEQADNSIQRQYGGTGLGLSITKKLVNMMRGNIDCQSIEGVGSEFTVELPLQLPHETTDIPFTLANVKIAIVGDDDKFENDLYSHLTKLSARCEIITRALFNAHLIDSNQFNYLIITAETFQLMSTEGKDVFIDGSNCHYILLDNSQYQVPKPSNVNISSLPLYPYYASKVSTHIATLENILEDKHNEPDTTNSPVILPSIQEAEEQGQLILVVEDNVYNQDLFKRQLATLGLQCVIADNGKIALQLLERFNFALIISDCHMPIMDGYEFAKQRRLIEKQNNLPEIPIIAATANALDGEEQNCIACGMSDYLAKPILLQDLNKKLKHWLHVTHSQVNEPVESSTTNADSQPHKYINFDELENYVGTDRTLQLLFLEKFVSDTQTLIDKFDLNSRENIKNIAHQVKTSAKTVGSTLLAEKLQELEAASQKESLQHIENLIQECKQLFRSAQEEIATILVNTG